MPHNTIHKTAKLTAAIYFFFAAQASAQSSADSSNQSQLPLWEFGALNLNISQQAYPGSDQQIQRTLVLPTFIYRGEHFRSDRDSAGYRAIKTPTYELDVSFSGAFGPGDDVINARVGMPKLGTLVEFGPRLKVNITNPADKRGWDMSLPIRGVFDLRDSLAQRGLKFEPTLSYRGSFSDDWRYNLSAGLVFSDKKLSQTLYGVDSAYATATRQSFEAKGGFLSTKLALTVNKKINTDWRFFAFSRMESVDGSANQDSPLVKQKVGSSIGFGISYTWQRSKDFESN